MAILPSQIPGLIQPVTPIGAGGSLAETIRDIARMREAQRVAMANEALQRMNIEGNQTLRRAEEAGVQSRHDSTMDWQQQRYGLDQQAELRQRRLVAAQAVHDAAGNENPAVLERALETARALGVEVGPGMPANPLTSASAQVAAYEPPPQAPPQPEAPPPAQAPKLTMEQEDLRRTASFAQPQAKPAPQPAQPPVVPGAQPPVSPQVLPKQNGHTLRFDGNTMGVDPVAIQAGQRKAAAEVLAALPEKTTIQKQAKKAAMESAANAVGKVGVQEAVALGERVYKMATGEEAEDRKDARARVAAQAAAARAGASGQRADEGFELKVHEVANREVDDATKKYNVAGFEKELKTHAAALRNLQSANPAAQRAGLREVAKSMNGSGVLTDRDAQFAENSGGALDRWTTKINEWVNDGAVASNLRGKLQLLEQDMLKALEAQRMRAGQEAMAVLKAPKLQRALGADYEGYLDYAWTRATGGLTRPGGGQRSAPAQGGGQGGGDLASRRKAVFGR